MLWNAEHPTESNGTVPSSKSPASLTLVSSSPASLTDVPDSSQAGASVLLHIQMDSPSYWIPASIAPCMAFFCSGLKHPHCPWALYCLILHPVIYINSHLLFPVTVGICFLYVIKCGPYPKPRSDIQTLRYIPIRVGIYSLEKDAVTNSLKFILDSCQSLSQLLPTRLTVM